MANDEKRDRMTGTPHPIVAMGVSASGKSSLGEALAEALGCPFLEGDDEHPPANVAKMKAGIPLTDEDRAPWLARIAAWLGDHDGCWAVASCSALRRAYRDRLRAGAPHVAFVLMDVDRDTLAERLRGRPGHFMPPELLDSQLATLERPLPDERVLILDATRPRDVNRDEALGWVRGG